jgi:hypothetical protein
VKLNRARALDLFAVGLVVLAVSAIAAKNYERNADVKLLNVSYDPTRELYQQLNPRFIEQYQKETGRRALVTQSHGGSSRQARTVVEGEQVADVVMLGLRSDVEALHKRALLADGWWTRLPNNSQPYSRALFARQPKRRLGGAAGRGARGYFERVLPAALRRLVSLRVRLRRRRRVRFGDAESGTQSLRVPRRREWLRALLGACPMRSEPRAAYYLV